MKLNDLQKHEIQEWTDEVEDLLRSLSDKAQVWTDLHLENHLHFRKRYYNLVIPIIVLSSVTGSANLALGSLPTSSNDSVVINLVIGVVGIITSVLSTLNNIFSFQKRKDDHKRAADEWCRVHRIINIEINLARTRRNNVSTFLFLVLQEVERIFDTQPKLRTVIKTNWIRRYNLEQKKIFKRNVALQSMSSQSNTKLLHIIENELVELPEILLIKRTLVYRDRYNDGSFMTNSMTNLPNTPNSSFTHSDMTQPHTTPSTLLNPLNSFLRADSTLTENKSTGVLNTFSKFANKAKDFVSNTFYTQSKNNIETDSNDTSIFNSSHDDQSENSDRSDHIIQINHLENSILHMDPLIQKIEKNSAYTNNQKENNEQEINEQKDNEQKENEQENVQTEIILEDDTNPDTNNVAQILIDMTTTK